MKQVQFEVRVSVEDINDKWFCDLYTGDGDWIGQTEGDELGNTFRHAMVLVDPVYAAAMFPDHFEWTDSHSVPMKG